MLADSTAARHLQGQSPRQPQEPDNAADSLQQSTSAAQPSPAADRDPANNPISSSSGSDGANDSNSVSFARAFFYSHGSVFGSILIWFLILLSAFSAGLMGYLWVINRRTHILPDPVVNEARTRIVNRQYRELLTLANNDATYFGSVLAAALREAPHGYGAMIRALEQAGDEFTIRRFRKLEILSVIGNVAPMLGLFGTVYGIIVAFQEIVAAGGRPSPVQLAAGIGTALVTTFWGLVIGIPCIAAYALIRNSVDALTSEAMLIAQGLINNFRPGAAPAGGSDGSAGGNDPITHTQAGSSSIGSAGDANNPSTGPRTAAKSHSQPSASQQQQQYQPEQPLQSPQRILRQSSTPPV